MTRAGAAAARSTRTVTCAPTKATLPARHNKGLPPGAALSGGCGFVMAATRATTQREDDTRLLDFVREKVDTFVKWELVRFFHDNPYAADSAENIARFAARDVRTVEKDLQALVRSGVLESSVAGNGTTRLYRYIKDQQV